VRCRYPTAVPDLAVDRVLIRAVAVYALELYSYSYNDSARDFFLAVAIYDHAWSKAKVSKAKVSLLAMGEFVAAVLTLTRKLVNNYRSRLPAGTDRDELLVMERRLLQACGCDLWFTTAVDLFPAVSKVVLYDPNLAARCPETFGEPVDTTLAQRLRSLVRNMWQ
jgi:hypothetical protein